MSAPASSINCSRLSGKVALITGATKGIGFATAQRLQSEGAKVVICSRNGKNVDSAVKELNSNKSLHPVVGLICHVGTQEARKKLIEETIKLYNHIDILVSNVAVNPMFGPMLDNTTEANFDKIFDVNVKSHFFLIQLAVPHMPENSSIIIISSYAGYNPSSMLGAYSVSKTALIGLTKVLAKDLVSRKIRCNCLAPGIIQTRFSEQLWKNEDVSKVTIAEIPMQRYGEPSEMAAIVAFLASTDSSYVTGETIVAAGGIQSRL